MNSKFLINLPLILFFVFISAYSFGSLKTNSKANQFRGLAYTDTTESKSPLVMATFIVDELGNIGNIKIQKVVCETCNKVQKKIMENTVRNTIKELPDWTPGKQDGRPVKVKYTLPVRFKMVGDSLILPTKEK